VRQFIAEPFPSGVGPRMKSWIRVVEEGDAQGELAEIYAEVRGSRGRVSNVMKVHSLDPKAMKLHLQLYLHLMYGKSSITRTQREMIAVLVSHLNGCQYCVTHHKEALQAHARTPDIVKSLQEDFSKALISKRDRALLEYAAKLTRQPSLVDEMDVRRMAGEGFTDEEILRVNLIVSYFNFVNRIVAGLGTPLEETNERVYKY
jgi:uncharacterized peroxidase-related enzyme